MGPSRTDRFRSAAQQGTESPYGEGLPCGGPITAQLLDELGYDPDDGVPELNEVAGGGPGDCLRIGSVMAARIGARRVAVARLGSGRLVVVDDVCPHDGGRISDGFVDGEHLICARHGWELAPRNGRCERACKLRE